MKGNMLKQSLRLGVFSKIENVCAELVSKVSECVVYLIENGKWENKIVMPSNRSPKSRSVVPSVSDGGPKWW